jgi:hypothetical protein
MIEAYIAASDKVGENWVRAWLGNVNPKFFPLGRGDHNQNCGECSRAVAEAFAGTPRVACGEGYAQGEHRPAMEEWAGAPMGQVGGPAEVAARLQAMGPGAHAIIDIKWQGGGGHFFNMVNLNGTIYYVDGQSNSVSSTPPVWLGNPLRSTHAMFAAGGNQLRWSP